MTFIEVCQKVSDEGLLLFREIPDAPLRYEVREHSERVGKNNGWVFLDVMTANLCLQIHGALNEEQKRNLEAKPALRITDICWKLYGKIKQQPS